MKSWHKIVIALVVIPLIAEGAFWWSPFHELSKGQLAIIGFSDSNPDIPGIYLFNPLFRFWRHLSTDNLYPHYIAWSPDGKKIAFTYSVSSTNSSIYDIPATGIAILTLENEQTQQVYIPPSKESLNVVTWSPDGKSLVFDVYENNTLMAFRRLDITTGKLQSIPFPTSIQPQYFGINHLEVAQNNDYVIGGYGIFIAPANLINLRPITPLGDLSGFFLTPDRKEITFSCTQSALCNYSIDTNEITKTYLGTLPTNRDVRDGNWSYDEEDVVYRSQGGGEEAPHYIMLVNIQNQQNYIIYKLNSWFGPDV